MTDTSKKRGSAIATDPVTPVLPTPDGSVDEGDRRQIGQTYRFGLGEAAAGGEVEVQIVVNITMERRRRRS